jgi:Arc/MetJ-type ribon-helix-helix transcriptional regulator
MSVITVPVSDKQRATIEHMVKSGRAATKAHAIRMAIDLLAREDALASIRRGQQEIREGKTLSGDLDALAKQID